MRDLTPEEILIRDRRREGIRAFLGEIRPALEDFVRKVVIENPELYTRDPERFLPVLEQWLRDENLAGVATEDRVWLELRIAYLIGELLRKRFDAVWMLDEDPSSRFFLRYVLGYFKDRKSGLVVDPVSIAAAYLDTPPPRSLVTLVDGIEELRTVDKADS